MHCNLEVRDQKYKPDRGIIEILGVPNWTRRVKYNTVKTPKAGEENGK